MRHVILLILALFAVAGSRIPSDPFLGWGLCIFALGLVGVVAIVSYDAGLKYQGRPADDIFELLDYRRSYETIACTFHENQLKYLVLVRDLDKPGEQFFGWSEKNPPDRFLIVEDEHRDGWKYLSCDKEARVR